MLTSSRLKERALEMTNAVKTRPRRNSIERIKPITQQQQITRQSSQDTLVSRVNTRPRRSKSIEIKKKPIEPTVSAKTKTLIEKLPERENLNEETSEVVFSDLFMKIISTLKT